MTKGYDFYGAEVSYFSGKVRAYLRYKRIPFSEITPSRDIYRNVIMARVGWPVIPVVVTPEDETWQDSSEIIDNFEARFPEGNVYPEGARQKFAALLIEAYADEWLKLPAMHYRWTKNRDWAVSEFGRLSRPDLDEAGQRATGEETAKPFAGALPFLGVTPETGPAIEKSYEGLLAELDAHFAKHEFLFGTRPSIGDFGLYGPLYAHQYRDPASGEIMKRLAPNVVKWVMRMTKPPQPKGGAFLADDEVPETLTPVLERIMREYLPVLIKTADALKKHVEAHPDLIAGKEPLPRALGQHEFTLEGVTASRAIFAFDLWMLQRPLDFLATLRGEQRDGVLSMLKEAGGERLADFPPYPRLTRRQFRLVVE
ncbi:glutathione S-transferase family protein [Parvibaculum sp.]|jgi:glutathione S-transferase|uniref:glutathione S-transferase family protein n=3 Tax=Parvibaculum sp. TaxID=2024848 RepID=UPI001B2EAED0|nr:glutathione S-transferase family protein [Parvibaculum sp.]MBO6678152.1 glutathione S-transferase [Parvibaculum sp.]MBO6683700.1 glutathione S-transferase [Parvibaculum sp.]MBO6906462.1 glutathione S-transferase [Parvibaculum sp.]